PRTLCRADKVHNIPGEQGSCDRPGPGIRGLTHQITRNTKIVPVTKSQGPGW
ncbi:hypothetical protein LEMLEM_LOCUS15671, partial [Lemmus lemmus]